MVKFPSVQFVAQIFTGLETVSTHMRLYVPKTVEVGATLKVFCIAKYLLQKVWLVKVLVLQHLIVVVPKLALVLCGLIPFGNNG